MAATLVLRDKLTRSRLFIIQVVLIFLAVVGVTRWILLPRLGT